VSQAEHRVTEGLKAVPLSQPKTVHGKSPTPPTTKIMTENDKRNQLIADEEAQNDRRRQFVMATFESLYTTYTNICSPIIPREVDHPACSDWIDQNLIRIDALDALWIMGLKSEFLTSARWVEAHFDFSADTFVKVSDASSRVIGGLLGAFELSNRPSFLQIATKIADRLLLAFESNTHGLPLPLINLHTGAMENYPHQSDDLLLGDLAATQLEFSYISHHINEPRYGQKALHIFKQLRLHPVNDEIGLYGSHVSPKTGLFQNAFFTLNTPSDLFFNHAFKLYRMFYKRVKWANEMWFEIRNGIMKHLATSAGPFSFAKQLDLNHQMTTTYTDSVATEGGEKKKAAHDKTQQSTAPGKNGTQPAPSEFIVGHSSCVMAGLLALHAQDMSDDAAKAKSLLGFAESFVDTCVQMNLASPNGIASDFSRIVDGKLLPIQGTTTPGVHALVKGEYVPVLDEDKLTHRADTFEALFYLSRLTGDPKYRNTAWQLFEAVVNKFQLRLPGSKGAAGFSKSVPSYSEMKQPTDHLSAPTMRYLVKVLKLLFLTFSDNDVLPIDKYVWNPDAHALSIMKPDISLYG
jgi:mannosyl-oligosaccharide alpha-1,2-mannosidase